MMLTNRIFIAFVVNLWKTSAFTQRITGQDVLLVDMENYNSSKLSIPFLSCLFDIFDFHYDEYTYSDLVIVCAKPRGYSPVTIFTYQPLVLYKCLATDGNGDLDKTLSETRQILDARKNSSTLITLVVTGANLMNTDLNENNKKFFRDDPNMLIVITHTDVVISADIAQITGSKDRIITFGSCSEEIKKFFPKLLCQPASREPIVGNCSYDNVSHLYQRKIFVMPLVQRPGIVCPGIYPQITKLENCSAIDNQTISSDNHNHLLSDLLIPLVVLCVFIICLAIVVAFICWKKHKKSPKKQPHRKRITSQISFTTKNQPTTSTANDQKRPPNQPRSMLESGRGFGKSIAKTSSFQHGETRSVKKANSKMHPKAKS